MEKKIFATITHVAEKIKEAFSGHNGDKNAHSDMRNQIEVLPDNIKKINNSDNWNAGNTKPKDYINLFKPNGARKCTDLGLPATAGYWTSVFGINNYNGDTGVTEVALTDKQNIFFRTQVGTSKMENWNGAKWKELATTDSSLSVKPADVFGRDFNNANINGMYHIVDAKDWKNKPPTSESVGNMIVMSGTTNNSLSKIQYFIPFNGSGIYIRTRGYGLAEWTTWKEVATTEKIDISSLLTSGWSVGNYRVGTLVKTGNVVTGTISLKAGNTAYGTVILTLPPEYRPNGNFEANGVCFNGSTLLPCVAYVQADGVVGSYHIPAPQGSVVSLNFNFSTT